MSARLLVVDDDKDELELLRAGLRIEGFDVLPATCAEEACRIAASTPVDLALIDLMMPGISGLELARQLRASDPRVVLILTSAYHLSENQLARTGCGIAGFVPKPFRMGELIDFIRYKLKRTNVTPLPLPVTLVASGIR